jgi:lysophospholipase L1-like esterase
LGGVIALATDFAVRQIYLKFKKPGPGPESHPIRVADEKFHHGLKPNSQAIDSYGPFSAPYFSNSLGLRDEKIREVPLQADHPRILFIGDSFTEGGPIPWEKTFVGVVSEGLKPKNTEVLNAGVASYSPTLIKIKLRYLLQEQGLRVDRVVVCIDISDIKDELYYEEGPDGCARQVAYGPFRDQAAQLRRSDEICGWLESHVEKNFVIIGAIVRNARLQWRRHASSTGVTEYDAIPDWAYNWPDYHGEYADLVEKGLAKIKVEMTRLAQELRERKVALTLVVYPWPQQVRAGTKPSRAETEWASWARENGAQFISLFPVFVNSPLAEEVIMRCYWKNDAHWNEEGHRLVADALLLENGGILLPAKTKN